MASAERNDSFLDRAGKRVHVAPASSDCFTNTVVVLLTMSTNVTKIAPSGATSTLRSELNAVDPDTAGPSSARAGQADKRGAHRIRVARAPAAADDSFLATVRWGPPAHI
jgi:hypothetical protein